MLPLTLSPGRTFTMQPIEVILSLLAASVWIYNLIAWTL